MLRIPAKIVPFGCANCGRGVPAASEIFYVIFPAFSGTFKPGDQFSLAMQSTKGARQITKSA